MGISTDENYPPDEVQRWTAKRRAALVTSILRGETSAPEAARKHGLTVAEIEDWKEKAVAAMENALRSRPKDEEGLKDIYLASFNALTRARRKRPSRKLPQRQSDAI